MKFFVTLFLIIPLIAIGQSENKFLTSFGFGVMYNNQAGTGVKNSIGVAATVDVEYR